MQLPEVEASRGETRIAEDRATITAACVLSVEVEEGRKEASSKEIRAEAREHLYKDQTDRVKELEDQIKRLARLQ